MREQRAGGGSSKRMAGASYLGQSTQQCVIIFRNRKRAKGKRLRKKWRRPGILLYFHFLRGSCRNCGTGVRFSLPTSNIPGISLKHVQLAR